MKDIDAEAERLTELVNQKIEETCEGRSKLEWEALAERVIEENIDTECWRYRLLTTVGMTRHPRMVLVAYDPPRHEFSGPDDFPVDG